MVAVEAVKDNPLPVVVAEIVAVGVPAATPIMAKSAEVVDVPPIRKSVVVMLGYSVPLVVSRVHFEDPDPVTGHVPQVAAAPAPPDNRQLVDAPSLVPSLIPPILVIVNLGVPEEEAVRISVVEFP
jgi:hypothetical protein